MNNKDKYILYGTCGLAFMAVAAFSVEGPEFNRNFSGEIVSIQTQEICPFTLRGSFEKVVSDDCSEYMQSVTVADGDKTFVASMRQNAALILAEDYVHAVGDNVNVRYDATLWESISNLATKSVEVEGLVISPFRD